MTRFHIAILATLLIVGCQKQAPEPTLVPVKGKVTVKGKPLTRATIVFHPDAEKGNTSKLEPRAEITPDNAGNYELESNDKTGAPPGWYRVTVYATNAVSSTKAPQWLANQKYTDPTRSGLSWEVKDDSGGKSADFDLAP
jgi:hypothetical protein